MNLLRTILFVAALITAPMSAYANCQTAAVTMIYADDCEFCKAAEVFFAQHGIVVDWPRSLDIGTLMNTRRYNLPGVPLINVEGRQILGFGPVERAEISALLCTGS